MNEKSKATVFINNIARGVNKEELTELFGAYGPLRSCFIVIHKDGPNKGMSKGFGFAQYVEVEDSKKATEALNGYKLNNQYISVESAKDPKIRVHASSTVHKAKEDLFFTLSKDSKDPAATANNLRASSIILFGLPDNLSQADLLRKMSRYGKVNAIEYPLKSYSLKLGRRDFEPFKTALVIFTNKKDANKACKILVNKNFNLETEVKGEKVRVMLTARKYTLVAVALRTKKGNRIILRNVSFKIKTNEELYEEVKKFGSVVGVNLSLKSSEEKDEEEPAPHRGFAFIQFACKVDATGAIKELNGKKIRNKELVADFALESKLYEKLQSEVIKATAEKNEPVETATPFTNETKQIIEEDEDELNHTLFVRNIKFETTQDEIFEFFKQFGPVRYVKICMDEKKRSRGSAFINFYKQTSYQRALNSGVEMEFKPKNKDSKHLAGQSIRQGLVLQGRNLLLSPAMDKKNAALLAVEEERKGNKRNLYLLKKQIQEHQMVKATDSKTKGKVPSSIKRMVSFWSQFFNETAPVIKPKEVSKLLQKTRLKFEPYSDEQKYTLPQKDITKRKFLLQQQKEKMQSPKFVVSETRLTILNLNKRIVADILLKYIVSFVLKAIKLSLGLELDESEDVTSCRVMREKGNKSKSKGFAFVDFRTPKDAMLARKALDNNIHLSFLSASGIDGLKFGEDSRSRLIVEFTMEDNEKKNLMLMKQKVNERNSKERLQAMKVGKDYQQSKEKSRKKKKRKSKEFTAQKKIKVTKAEEKPATRNKWF
eukprot:snap_masked-scaffold_15-processed-gene-7.6-mRNA-1 protein AED:1.00 eAED:1.00 QI:0/0/0/0/1/1/2/0/768